MDIVHFITVVVSILISSLQASGAVDSILQPNSLMTDGMTLVSKGGSFELGFFSPGSSGKHYLGIWYKNVPIQTVVWVANRDKSIHGSSVTAKLMLNSTGNLVLAQDDTIIWNSTSLKQVQNPVAELLDSGNLVVRDEKDDDPEAYLWQSFDYPSDTLLSGMKLGYDLRTGLNRRLTAWKTPEDPSPSDFYLTLAPRDYPEFYIMKEGSKFFRNGPWNGVGLSGSPELKENYIFDFEFVSTRNEAFYRYTLKNSSIISRYTINLTEQADIRYVWLKGDENWKLYAKKPSDYCDQYKLCGPNGKCVITESPPCQCLKGFVPKSPQKWNSVDWSDGCVRNKPLNCSEKYADKFMKMEGLKLPETTNSWLDETMNLVQCREKCLDNCSCMAYTNSDIRGAGSGCVLWFGDLIDIKYYASGGEVLYVRMPAPELEPGKNKKLIMIVAITIAVILCILLVGSYFIYRVCRKRIEKSRNAGVEIQNNERDDLDLPLFDLPTIAQATENLSEKNKIGEGGFGPVYWGKLLNGQEIAVKKLSRRSELGFIEFKNEVKFIAKLQHRNLVKLLGCCVHEQEKLLVYEYMPNRSLDSFIFDETKRKLLDWFKRFHIIMGIGRGLLYLHQDSRLRIIHRDLKASNILLDDKLIPKISDFGSAKTFGEEEKEGSTKRVVGTYGYMAPEYAADGLYSVKSDVFSYGILMLEIIRGKKNRGFYLEDSTHNLASHAWLLWKEGKVLELLDKNMQELCNVSEVVRCIHVSLLCVQQNPDDRPTIASAILMLESEVALPEPKLPDQTVFCNKRNLACIGLPYTLYNSMDIVSFITTVVSILVPSFQASMAVGSILQSNSPMSDRMRIFSKGGSFELGFFTPGNSGKQYLGIWYRSIPIQTVVWVANRDNPINGSSTTATLTLNSTGSLVLTQNDSVIWYSTPLKPVQNSVAELLDSGNLVVRHERGQNSEAYLWQSFDYPTDTLLSGMKLGCDLRTGLNRRLTSWKTPEDPSPGDFSITVDPRNHPELYILRGKSKFFRTGPWNGVGFGGSPELKQNPIFDFGFVSTRDEIYYYWHSLKNSSVISRYVINQTEEARIRYVWTKGEENWKSYTKKPSDNCDQYKWCGPNGKCVITGSPPCQCLKGFTPKSPQKWNSVDWSDGCVRNKPLNCSENGTDKFIKLEGLKVPETTDAWLDKAMNLEQCREKCLENCSCMAYTNSDIRGGGSGCALWFGDLNDIRSYASGGQDLYVRMPASELESGNNKKLIMIVAIAVAVILCMLLVGGYLICKVYRKRIEKSKNAEVEIQNNEREDLDLPLFDLPIIEQATENFSEKNKIGQGGFGPVYWVIQCLSHELRIITVYFMNSTISVHSK
ncbi:G-type lectin S-receptor-like serine/threonine-protein kinase At4g27290, partial [Neltuma alba]|uniref:G-type lectin S-receptor-like serine/threonine-protein kinase At4g27290 n=1 Tax=Neltuma alba TaxID=207710 RepID=UPI0010A4439A